MLPIKLSTFKGQSNRGEYSLYGDNIAYAVLITKDQGHDEL